MHKYALSLLAAWLLPLSAGAGTLLLGNGDRITGELIGIYDQQVHWQSDLMGEVVVGQVDVRSIDARDPFRIRLDANRELSQCILQSSDGEQWLNCEQGMVALTSWRLVERVTARPLDAPDMWRKTGEIAMTGTDRGGNAQGRDLRVDGRAEMRKGVVRHIGTLRYDRANSGETKTADARKVTYQFDYFVSDKLFFNTNLAWEQDLFQELQSRTLLGAGAGYQLYDSELIKLAFELGPALLRENYRDEPDRESAALRGTTDLRITLNRFGLELFHRNELLQSFDKGEDWRIDTETGFAMPVIGRLKASTMLEYDYNNRPADNAVPKNRVWTFGLHYSW